MDTGNLHDWPLGEGKGTTAQGREKRVEDFSSAQLT